MEGSSKLRQKGRKGKIKIKIINIRDAVWIFHFEFFYLGLYCNFSSSLQNYYNDNIYEFLFDRLIVDKTGD